MESVFRAIAIYGFLLLLFRITGAQGKQLGGFTILNSHPLTENRLAAAKQNAPATPGPALLSPAEWRALKAICGSGNSNQ